MAFIVVYDANVLVGNTQRDLLVPHSLLNFRERPVNEAVAPGEIKELQPLVWSAVVTPAWSALNRPSA